MGNALETPATDKETVRFERSPTARKVCDLWVLLAFVIPAARTLCFSIT